jgi:hypothetical protein
MNKAELIMNLEKGNKIEEDFVATVAYFYQHVVDNLQLDKASIKKIDDSLKILEIDSRKHKAMVTDLLEQARKGQKNEY